jgi:hypothetical protein
LTAISPYILEDGSMEDCKVNVIEYDNNRGEFLVEFEDKYSLYSPQDTKKKQKLRKYCCRSNLQLEYESKFEAIARRK